MYAIIATGGKQYRVAAGDKLRVERVPGEVGQEIILDQVLAVKREDGLEIGTPTVAGARVVARLLDQGRAKKVRVLKYKPKKNYRKRAGHRQHYSLIRIEKIEA